MNNYFTFKQFTVYQDKTAMKVGVDGVLLGAWTKTANAKTILDIGTGTGLLSLMLAQKSDALITAIDLDENSYHQAKFNFESSDWNEQLAIENVSFQDLCKRGNTRYDLIICNPPYFVNSQKSPDAFRNTARHDDLLPLETLFKGVSKLLNKDGRFVIIYPYNQKESLFSLSARYQLNTSAKLIIKGAENKIPNRIILEFSYQNQTFISEQLTVRDSYTNDYTAEYKKLTSDYYLAF